MPEELEVFKKLAEAEVTPDFSVPFTGNYEVDQQIVEHKAWLKTIRHEQPSPRRRYRVGIYIRYFNQTKHDNYLEYHIRQYQDTMALCPNWELVDFYIDEGATAPNMESAKEWCRLLSDCFAGKVDLIITQKVSNVSKKHYEITILTRMLAALENRSGSTLFRRTSSRLPPTTSMTIMTGSSSPQEIGKCCRRMRRKNFRS